jgi:DNA repair protein RadA/Sms
VRKQSSEKSEGGQTLIRTKSTAVAHGALRLKESAKLGFSRALVPPSVKGQAGISTQEFRTLANLVDHMLGRP